MRAPTPSVVLLSEVILLPETIANSRQAPIALFALTNGLKFEAANTNLLLRNLKTLF